MLFSNKYLFKLIIPLVFEQLLAVAIGMVDTVMVSGVGEAAVSGISISDAINFLFITIFSALATGGAVICAQYIGKNDEKSASDSAKQVLYVSLIISVVFALICAFFRVPILRLIYGDIEADVMSNASVYFLMTAISFPALALYSAAAAIFRAMGNSKISLYASVIMNIVNFGVCAVTILGFKWGAAGAGLAALAARCFGAVFLLILIVNPTLKIHVERIFKPELNWDNIKRFLKVGIPSGIENSMFQIGKLLTQGIITTFGTAAIAANAVAGSIANILYICGTAISLAMITVVGACIGAGDEKQAKYYTFKLIGIAFAASVMMGVSVYIFAPSIVTLFNLSGTASVLAVRLIRLSAVAAALMHELAFSLPNALRATGDVKHTMIVSVASMWIMRVVMSYVLAYYFKLGVMGVWIAMFSDWLIRSIFFAIRFLSGKWKNRALV